MALSEQGEPAKNVRFPKMFFDDLKSIESKGEARKYIHGYLFEILEALKEQRSNKTPELLDKSHSVCPSKLLRKPLPGGIPIRLVSYLLFR